MKFAALVCLIMCSANAAFAQGDARLSTATKKILPGIIELRHRIHQHPELSNREFKTENAVADELRTLGLEVRTGVAHTGVVGVLKGGKAGKTIALRADMDALPVREETDYPFRSMDTAVFSGQTTGVMHACGHDIHTSVMLGVAGVPAEEGAPPGEEGGASLMLKEGVFKELHPDVIYGLHSDPSLEVGQLGYSLGATNASISDFSIRIIGRSAHAASPELSVDPVVIASQVVLALQTIRSRNLSPLVPGVITVAQIHGGIRNNIIPSEVQLGGTIRMLDLHAQDEVEKRIHEILEGITKAGGGTYTLDIRRDAPVNMSDSALQLRMLPTMERIVGKGNVRLVPPAMAADDHAFFAQQCPSFFFDLGTTKPGTHSGSLHTPGFKGDDGAIEVGIKVISAMVMDFLYVQ